MVQWHSPDKRVHERKWGGHGSDWGAQHNADAILDASSCQWIENWNRDI